MPSVWCYNEECKYLKSNECMADMIELDEYDAYLRYVLNLVYAPHSCGCYVYAFIGNNRNVYRSRGSVAAAVDCGNNYRHRARGVYLADVQRYGCA